MKTFRLVLVSLFAFAAVGTGQETSKRNVQSVEESILPGREPSLQVQRETGSPLRRRFCPGCFTPLELSPGQEDAGRIEIKVPTLPALERSQQEAPKRNVQSVEESILPAREPSLQVQGETGSPPRRRLCPGCFTALELEDSKRNVRSVEESIMPGQEPSLHVQGETGSSAMVLPWWRCFRPGCFSVFNQGPVEEDRDHIGIGLPTWPPLEQSQQEASKRNVRSVEESIMPGGEPSLHVQVQGETDSPARRTYCSRSGCYSALNPVPVQEDPGHFVVELSTLPPLERRLQVCLGLGWGVGEGTPVLWGVQPKRCLASLARLSFTGGRGVLLGMKARKGIIPG
ncbi:uncharacterized protein LOC117056087 isoform X3 [Lacerta agilis]|uniref:uncharacterized protein LOC117056087 isoform X3 n=1 Tax=Lacerta agilis TaxID=80427 RepID=UPI00141A2131|nr:uncharacterized protein LOC117056087 isoform X3 [Lacerta agilis]